MRRMRWLRWIAFVLFLAALVGYEAYVLFVAEFDLTEHLPPAKEVHLSREVYGPSQLEWGFLVHANGFSAIEVFPRKSAYPPDGLMRVRVSDGRQGVFTPLLDRVLDSASLDLNGSVRIPVPRVDDSAGGFFTLEIWMPYAERGHGLRFEQGGPGYPEGNLTIGGSIEWADLKFRTEVQRATIFSNVQHLRRSLPPWLQSDVMLLGILLLVNWAIATVVYALAFAGSAANPAAGPAVDPAADPAADRDQSPNGSVAATALQPRV